MNRALVHRLHRRSSRRLPSNRRLRRNRRKEFCLRPAICGLSFEFSRTINVQLKIMKKYSAITLIIALAVCVSQFAHAQGNKEANKLAREGADASKNQDWDKAVELLRKASALDHKYARSEEHTSELQ